VSNPGAVGREAGFDQGFDEFHEMAGDRARAEDVRHAVLRSLSDRPASKRTFLYVHLLDPHVPYLSGSLPATARPLDAVPAYRAELRYLDVHLAALLKAVRARLPQPLTLFLTSDHGEEFGEHGEGGHGHTLYRELLHVPALIDNGQSGGEDVAEPLEARDFFELMLLYADAPVVDIAAWGRSRARERRYASVYLTTTQMRWFRPYRADVCSRAIESEGHVLIWSAYGSTLELYDVFRDPRQVRNRVGEDPVRLAKMREALDTAASRWASPEELSPSPENLERLRALGYIN
jgi:arylsulfatase A-like enzyme